MNQMYGCDIGKFMESVEDSMTYKLSGANMVVAGLMSDAQEQLAGVNARRNAIEAALRDENQRLARFEAELTRLDTEFALIAGQGGGAEEVARLTEAFELAVEVARAAEESAQAAEEAQTQAREAEAAARGPLEQATLRAQRLETEVRTLENLLQSAAGGLWAPVVESMTVAKGYETALGAALGCARLLGLPPGKMAHAISLALVPNIALNQTRTGTLSMWKGMAGPQGARAGVNAACMAREGMTGPDGVFEGKYGFWNQLMDGKTFTVPMPTQFADHTFAVQQTMIKSFPTRFNCQVPVFTAQKLRTMIKVTDIASLKIESIRQAFARWMDLPEIWKPETRETADHSLPCTVAMALIDGTITPKMMDTGRFKDGDVLALMQKCKLEMPDEFADLAPETRCCRITATLKNGNTVVAEQRRSLADDAADTGWEQALVKLAGLTSDVLSASARAQLVTLVANLENQKSIAPLLDATRLGAP